MARDHTARLIRVIDHIAANLDAPLTLERLAAVACFSPYHFHRVYRAVMGETTDQTVRRLRLHRAAVALREGQALNQVARAAGYGSPEAFSRAFAAAYGRPPTAYRAAVSTDPGPPGAMETQMYDVTIETTPALRLIGFPHRGAYDAIGGVFDRLFAWAGPRGLIGPQPRAIGVYYDDPSAVAAADLRAFAGLAVGEEVVAEDGAEIVALPAGAVARLLFTGPYAELEAPYGWLYGGWLAQSGREPADAPCWEEYLNDPKTTPPAELKTAIFMPLV